MKVSNAVKKAIEYRDAIHKGKIKVQDKKSTAVVYVGENIHGKPTGVFYSGRKKPTCSSSPPFHLNEDI